MSYRRTGRPAGRPRYPGILTPAEERVLDGVRRGLTNAQIADELGLATETVKYHVANMLSKLYLDDRRELAAWEAKPEPRQPLLSAPLPFARRLFRSTPQLVGPAFLGGLAVVIAVMAMLTVRSEAPQVGVATPSPIASPDGYMTAPLSLSPLVLVPRAAVVGWRPQFIHDLASGVTITVGADVAPAWRPGIDIAAVALGSRLALFHARLRRWQLSDLPAPAEMSWSPRGDSLAFTAKQHRYLYVVDFKSGTVSRLPGQRERIHLPAAPWSADGEEIAVHAGGDVRAWNVVSHEWRTLNDPAVRDDASFLGWDGDDTAWLAGVSGEQPVLRAVDSRGDVSERAIPDAFDPSSVQLAPGGKLIAFRLRSPSEVVAVLEPATLRRVGDLDARGLLRWSPDGSQLAAYPTQCGRAEGVRVFDAVTARTAWVSNLTGVPAWSSDARWVALGRGPGLLVVVGPGGASSRRQIDLAGASDFSVAGWSDGGRFVALSSGSELRGHCAIEFPQGASTGT